MFQGKSIKVDLVPQSNEELKSVLPSGDTHRPQGNRLQKLVYAPDLIIHPDEQG